MHKLGCVALVLEGVVEEGVAHADETLLAAGVELIAQLLVPHPVVGVARGCDLVAQELVHHVDVVDDVEDQRLHLREEQVLATVVEACVALELPLQVTLVVLQLARFDSGDSVAAKVDHLRQTADLRGQVGDIKATSTLLTLL